MGRCKFTQQDVEAATSSVADNRTDSVRIAAYPFIIPLISRPGDRKDLAGAEERIWHNTFGISRETDDATRLVTKKKKKTTKTEKET